MIRIDDKARCCGCGSCANICPVGCIEMRPDEEGFLYPSVDEKRCVNCGRCEKSCPILLAEDGEPVWYASGTVRIVFDGDSRVYDQKGEDATAAVRRANVLDLFGKQPGSEETISPVLLKISDGLVTRAVWQHEP